ncbi:MAG: DUF4238 domain-containing protein [Pedobacter sp.]|nr:DUF4238 domain-containing protein [Pedobacter sp.]MDQ8051885.1 DUF4238 domain-containing protein [Pedobacter sp.]
MGYLGKFSAIIEQFKVALMKQNKKQNQHKLPQVYMRRFGYEINGHCKVSVLKMGERHTRQKSIESFLSDINIFDIDSDDPKIVQSFEDLNGRFETEYPNMISDLEKNGHLSEKSFAMLLQFIPNLIARSDTTRNLVTDLLCTDAKENFLKIICAHTAKSFEDLEQKDYFRVLSDSPLDNNIINRVLIFFTSYLFQRTAHYSIVILESQEDKPWFTTDNPIIFENQIHKFEIMGKDSEIYFPLTPRFLIYLHFHGSDDKTNPLRQLENNKIYKVDDEQNIELQQKIMINAHQYVIINGEFKYKFLND